MAARRASISKMNGNERDLPRWLGGEAISGADRNGKTGRARYEKHGFRIERYSGKPQAMADIDNR